MEFNEKMYDQLTVFIQNGSTNQMPAEMVDYLSMLELVRSLHFRFDSRDAIVKTLTKEPYNLSRYKAYEVYSDAVNFFYIDVKVTKEAFRNMYAEQLDRAADLVLKTSTGAKDMEIYKNIKMAAYNMRGLDKPDPQDIPKELFLKPNKIYVLDPELFGRPKANRRELAQHIDSLPIAETDKLRIKGDAMIEDIDFLEDETD